MTWVGFKYLIENDTQIGYPLSAANLHMHVLATINCTYICVYTSDDNYFKIKQSISHKKEWNEGLANNLKREIWKLHQ